MVRRISNRHLTAALLAALWAVSSIGPPAARATTLFGLVDTGELYASADGGASWSVLATLPVDDAVAIVAGSSSADLYLMTRSGTVYRSTDGTTWSAVGAVPASDVSGFTLTPGGDLLALTETGTLYSSSDGGANFTGLAALTGSNWVSLARGPLGRFYALTATGEVAESQDSGASWTVKGALTFSNAVSIRRMGNNLFVMTGTGEIAKSDDYGASWTTVGTLSESGMSALFDYGGTELLAAAATGEVAASSDGVSWGWIGAINQLNVTALGADTPIATGVTPRSAAPRFAARAPYPNPATAASGATFGFSLSEPARVRLELYDARGRLVASRPYETYGQAGLYASRWAPRGLASGTYFVRYVTDSGRSRSVPWTVVR
jgi:hypothetical protein